MQHGLRRRKEIFHVRIRGRIVHHVLRDRHATNREDDQASLGKCTRVPRCNWNSKLSHSRKRISHPADEPRTPWKNLAQPWKSGALAPRQKRVESRALAPVVVFKALRLTADSLSP